MKADKPKKGKTMSESTDETTETKEKKSRKKRVMKNYDIALWLDGKGFFKSGFEYTLIKSEAKIYTRNTQAVKAIATIKELAGVDGLRIVEFK